MATPAETAAMLVEGTFAVLQGDTAYKAQVVAQIVDQMIGSDPRALVRSIAGVPEVLVEAISDGLVMALEAAIMKRLTPAPMP